MTTRIVDIREVREATVSWTAIEARCSKYRDGFVKAFLEYKGKLLEDGSIVTQAAFADYFGIKRPTFNNWLKKRGLVKPHTKSHGGRNSNMELDDEPDPVESQLEGAGVQVSEGSEADTKTCKHCWVHCPSGAWRREIDDGKA